MALLSDTKSQRQTSKPRSTKPGSSSAPRSLPDLGSLQRIESLEKELTDAKASGDATALELQTLKDQLAAAQAKLAAAENPDTITRTDDLTPRKSFWGI